MKRFIWVYAALGAVGCLLGAAIAEVTMPQAPAGEPLAIALVIDASGSMDQDGKLSEVKRAAANFVRRSEPNSQLALVAFGSEALLLSPLTSQPEGVLGAIEQIEEMGATRMDLGLQAATEALASSSSFRQSILLFTDGVPSAGVNALGQPVGDDELIARFAYIRAQAARSNGIRVVAVGTEDADAAYLQQLTSNPDLLFSTTTGDFEQAFDQAQRAISSLFGDSRSNTAAYADSSIRAGVVALGLAALLLLALNLWGLRGPWYRDLWWVIPTSVAFGAVAGSIGQWLYAELGLRVIGWAFLGLGVGLLIGLADRSPAKGLRGAVGGLAGGALGGALFGLWQDQGLGTAGRLLGFAFMGGAIGAMVQVAQEVLKKAWLIGISLGPYEGKQYILAKGKVSVGSAANNDIALVADSSLAPRAGALRQVSAGWVWEGQGLLLNGQPYQAQVLQGGDKLKLGGSVFQFETLRLKGSEGYTLRLVPKANPQPPLEA